MTWNHETVYRSLVERGLREHVVTSERYVELYPQEISAAILYGPGGKRAMKAPLHVNKARESFRVDVFRALAPSIEFVGRDNKGPKKELQNWDSFRVVDWNGFASALNLFE
jgi:hypothetical protein